MENRNWLADILVPWMSSSAALTILCFLSWFGCFFLRWFYYTWTKCLLKDFMPKFVLILRESFMRNFFSFKIYCISRWVLTCYLLLLIFFLTSCFWNCSFVEGKSKYIIHAPLKLCGCFLLLPGMLWGWENWVYNLKQTPESGILFSAHAFPLCEPILLPIFLILLSWQAFLEHLLWARHCSRHGREWMQPRSHLLF